MSLKCITYKISRFINHRKIKALQKDMSGPLPFFTNSDWAQFAGDLFPGSSASAPMDSPQNHSSKPTGFTVAGLSAVAVAPLLKPQSCSKGQALGFRGFSHQLGSCHSTGQLVSQLRL